MNLHLLRTIMPRVDVDIKLNHLFRNEFSGTWFLFDGSISTCRSNSQFSNFFWNKCMHLLSRQKNNIPAASQLSVYTCRILSFIEHVYCFFRSSKFQLGCRLPRVGFVFNRPSPWRQRGTKIQQVSTSLWPASVSYILSYNICRQFFLLNQTHSPVLFSSWNTCPTSVF